jgi:16S rRNA (guanine1207-N2)-methyltransferase
LLLQPAVREGVYGRPSSELVAVPSGAVQLSPLNPNSSKLEDAANGSFQTIVMLAPSGVLERRFALAHALRALTPDGVLTVLAPKDKGGARLAKDLTGFGCVVAETSRRHNRICRVVRPANPVALDDAIAAGSPQIPPALGLWSQPGIFSWDRPDPGSVALIRNLPPLAGTGADFGCGVGLLAQAVLRNTAVTALTLVDIDRRAVEAARRNIDDPRAALLWEDIRHGAEWLGALDFVVMNPPFHDGGVEDRALGEAFIVRAAASLKPGGVCWLVANRHLPYEAALKTHFARALLVAQGEGYKIYEARR